MHRAQNANVFTVLAAHTVTDVVLVDPGHHMNPVRTQTALNATVERGVPAPMMILALYYVLIVRKIGQVHYAIDVSLDTTVV